MIDIITVIPLLSFFLMNTSRHVGWNYKEAKSYRNGSAGSPEGGCCPYYYTSDTTHFFGDRMQSKDEVPAVFVHQLDAALSQGHTVANFSFSAAQLVPVIHLVIMISKFSYFPFTDFMHGSL